MQPFARQLGYIGAGGARRIMGGRRAFDRYSNACVANITTPVDETITIPPKQVYCSSGAIEVDSVAAGDGIVQANGIWRLT